MDWSAEIARRWLRRYESTDAPSEEASRLYRTLVARLRDDPDSYLEPDVLTLVLALDAELDSAEDAKRADTEEE